MAVTSSFPAINAPVRIKLSLREAFVAAWEEKQVVFFSAPCGFGKTVAAQTLLAERSLVYLSARQPISPQQIEAAVSAGCLVLDDVQDLKDEELQTLVSVALEDNPQVKLVALSRGPVPSWLTPFKFRGKMKVFGASDLALDSVAAAHLFQDYSVAIPAASIALIMDETIGYPLAVCSCIRRMSEGDAYSPKMSEGIIQDLFDYFEIEVYRRLDPEARDLLMRSSLFDDADAELMEAVSGNDSARFCFEQLRASTSMTLRSGTDFRFWDVWLDFLSAKRKETYTAAQVEEMYDRAGDYYCDLGDVTNALSCYEKAKRPDKVRQLLIDNARLNVIKGSYYGAQSYYRRLTTQEIENSPLLIQGMSSVNALQMRYEDADYWQNGLLAFADNDQNTDIRRREARVRYAYADLALPHRGSAGIRKRLEEASAALTTEQIESLQYSLIASRNSMISGFQDFSKCVQEEGVEGISSLQPLMREVFGAEGEHFIAALPMELKYLRAEVGEHDVMELTKMLTRVRRDQLPELELAITSLLASIEMFNGDSDRAFELLKGLRAQFDSDASTRNLVPTIDAQRVFFNVQIGMEANVARWLSDEAPQDLTRPLQTDIFLYFAMAMGLTYVGEYRRALSVVCAFDEYLRACEREVDLIFTQTLSAVCLRQLDEEWRPQMAEALEIAAKYGYVQPFAQFADAVVPMVRDSGAKVSAKFLGQVEELAVKQTLRYPQFVKNVTVLEKPLTDTEQRVLELICNDMNNAQICEILDIKLPTVKTHVSHVFAKLGCKRRADARAAAARLGLV